MTSALTWLYPRPLLPVTSAHPEQVGIGGYVYDGLVAGTPEQTLAAVDLLAGPEGRALTLRAVLPPGAALARATAVWVHTGRLRPRRTEVVVAPSRRTHSRVVVHRQQLPTADVVTVGGVPTTTPLRTAVDLLCFAVPATALAGTRALLGSGLPRAVVAAALRSPGRRLPTRRALHLLEQLPDGSAA